MRILKLVSQITDISTLEYLKDKIFLKYRGLVISSETVGTKNPEK